jgi:hypothetical protein
MGRGRAHEVVSLQVCISMCSCRFLLRDGVTSLIHTLFQ